MNTKLHTVSDADGQPFCFFMTAGQVSDYTGAAALLDDLPKAQWLLGDRGYDADWLRYASEAKGIQPASQVQLGIERRSRCKIVFYEGDTATNCCILRPITMILGHRSGTRKKGMAHIRYAR